MGKRTRTESDDYECIAKKVKKLSRMLMRARRKNRSRTSSSSSDESSSESSRSGSASPPPGSRGPSTPLEPLCIEDVLTHASCAATAAHPSSSTSATAEPQPSTSRATAEPQPSTSRATTEPQPATSHANIDLQSACSVVFDPQQTTSTTVSQSMLLASDLSSTQAELNDDLLKILGEDPSQTKVYGSNIQPDLAIRLQHIATSGLSKEARKELMDKYLVPENCMLIDAPALNLEVKAAISEVVYKRDKGIEQKQKELSSATSCIAEALTKLMTDSKNTAVIQLLMDASKLLCDTMYSDSTTRRNFVLFNLKKELKDQLQATKIDRLLFGQELSDALKAAKAISKSGADMKMTAIKKPAKNSAKPNQKNLNWRAPPPSQYRQKGNQRMKEPAYRGRNESSSKRSSRPAQARSRR